MSIRLALAGNPNCGKTTMFNDLTGATQYVGNWPGVTVEKKEGKFKGDKEVLITDLPGIYSLSPYTLEEVVARDYLVNEKPQAIMNLVDASNIERNLYLTTQLLEMGIPVVIALNMMDIVKKRGDVIDVKKLSQELGVPVVETAAIKGEGTKELVEAAKKAAKAGNAPAKRAFEGTIENAVTEIEKLIADVTEPAQRRWFAVKLFERDSKVQARFTLGQDVQDKIEKLITAVEEELDDDAESIITDARYQYIGKLVKDCVKKKKTGLSTSDKIDHIVTNRILALPIFALIMWLVYYVSVSTAGGIFTDWANDGVFGDGWHLFTIGAADYEEATAEYDDQITRRDAWLEAADEAGIDTSALTEQLEAEEADETAIADAAAAIEADPAAASVVGTAEFEDEDSGEVTTENVDLATFEQTLTAAEPDPADFGVWVPGIPVLLEKLFASMGVNEDGWVYSLVMDGIVAGVGAVLGFVPQMLILFFFLAILEDCGYMARVAFIMDRIFRKFGLSGKSFIPMLIASGCGVPAVMATKTIENEKDRRMTIMTTTMIPCGAKMPIIALVFGAIASGNSDATWYVAPMFYFMGVIAIIISGIMLKKTKLFAGETTPFIMELPQYHMPGVKNILLSMWERVKGYIIKAGTIIFLSTIVIWFLMNFGDAGEGFGLLDSEAPDYMEYSLMAGLGNLLAWIFAPLGFANWQATATAVTGLVAKENVVATVGIITQLGDFGEADPQLWYGFAQMLGGSTAAIVAFCAFNLLCAPCFAAMGTIRQQQRSAKWFWITIGYMCGFAWCVGCMLYQFVGLALGEVSFSIWTVIAIIIAALMLFQIFRPMPNYDKKDEKVARKLETENEAA